MKNKELQIAQDNVSALMEWKFSFRPENILKKTILFDASRVHEETIINKIIENLPSANDEFYIIYEPGANTFSLRREDRK